MENDISKKLIYLIRTALGVQPKPENFKVTDSEALEIYDVAKRHDVGHLVSFALDKDSLLNTKDEKLREIRQVYLKSVRRCARQDFCYEEIKNCFSKNDIDFIPLKGFVTRNYYPERWMRTSGDLDILVRKEDYTKAKELAESNLGYKHEGSCAYHTEFSTDKNVLVEIHNSISDEDQNSVSNVLDEIWDTSVQSDICERKMRDDYYYFHHIFHMLRHFEDGGIGLRFFIDLYLLNKMQISDSEKKARKERIRAEGLEKFESGVIALAKYLFEGDIENEPEEDVLSQMLDYVFASGTYGTISQKVAYKSEKEGGRIKYIKRRVFMPYNEIKNSYPILEKHKILTPVYEVVRWCRLIFKKQSKNSSYEIKKTFAKSDTTDYTKMRKYLGL